MESLRSVLAVAILAAGVAQGQDAPHAVKGSVLDAVALPGDFASTNGNVSSYEKGNIVSDNYLEQRAVVFSTWHNSLTVTSYAALDFLLDTKGYNWNNKILPGVGFRLNKHVHDGVVSAGIGYVYEDRFRNVDDFKPAGGRTDFITDWFAWNDVTDKQNRFPGSTWAIVGHYSPVERGNLMERGHIQQGFVVKRFGTKALISYGEATLAHDSKGFNWENIAVFGAGVKAVIPVGDEYTDIGCGYLRETRLLSNRTVNSIKVFADFYYRWSLFGRRSQP